VPVVKGISWAPAVVANGVALTLLCVALLCRMLPMRTLGRGRNSPPRKE
jgi:protein-S-isoprenylcysteine O-methyltransferase Ste14